MSSKKYENIIFYLDIVGDLLKKKDITKLLVNFIKIKKEKNPQTKFGIMLVNSEGSPDYLGDQTDPDPLIKKIEEEWKSRETKESFMENGLFFALSQIAGKSISLQADHRIIVLSDLPSNKSEEYHDALFELITNVRFLPTYIDIIRIGKERFYPDDVKLRIITSTTNGGLYYVDNSKTLWETLELLTQNKQLIDLNQPEGKIYINEENQKFYENLASFLLTPEAGETGICILCKKETCDGFAPEYCGFLKCYNCNSFFHEAHVAIYSFEKNIGLPHVFRCPNCDVLLKIEEERALKINGIEKKPSNIDKLEVKENISSENTVQLQNIECNNQENQKIVQESPSTSPQTVTKRTPPGGFGFFGPPIINSEINTNKHVNSEVIAEPLKTQDQQVWVPPQESKTNELSDKKKPKKLTLKLCKICGFAVKISDTKCLNCGSPL